jgi:squalene-hopene/tetraprenyl-beta-curcumene cyclase
VWLAVSKVGRVAVRRAGLGSIGVILAVAAGLASCSGQAPAARTWDPNAAAAYLDRRMSWWESWRAAARADGTFCFSCHTAVPYAMARPSLRAVQGNSVPTADERRMMADVRKRVRLWKTIGPFYPDDPHAPGKTAESRGTEAVLSALTLTWADARDGHLSADTRLALENMWGEQLTSGPGRGAWAWLDFALAPWEIAESQYYGAALAALAVGVAPDDYASAPNLREHLDSLRDYLQREYPAQSLHHRLIVLWAAQSWPDLLSAGQRAALIAEVLRAQNPDGGWSLSRLIPSCNERVLLQEGASDGYATALATLALERTRDAQIGAQVARGRQWLVDHQQGHGGAWLRGREEFWTTASLNKHRNPFSNVGRFMSDAATAYAVLALTQTPETAP